MRSLGRELAAVGSRMANRSGDAPVAYEAAPALPFFNRSDAQAHLEAYLADPVLFASLDRFTTDIAGTPWKLMTKSDTGNDADRRQILSHAMIDLWEQPNPFMDRTEFLELAWLYYEAAAESYWVLGFDDRAPDLPLSMWPVRPDWMAPVTSPTKFLVGWVYNDPFGNQVPFPVEHVIQVKKPNPLDIYRGAGAVRALMTDLEGSVAAARWNRNFFLNSAEPGGIITVEDYVDDRDFERISAQWNRQHRGTANSHRVAVLSQGMNWVPRSFTNRDMQFVELRDSSDAHIMLALGMSKTLLGQTEGVNRATAEAAEYVYGKYRLVPRLNKLQGVLNRKLLTRYQSGQGLEWTYQSPITGNVEDEATELDSKMSAAAEMIGMGFDQAATLAAFGLPDVPFVGRPPTEVTPMVVAGAGPTVDELTAREQAEIIQKVYLGVDTVITWEEARELLRRGGIDAPAGVEQPKAAPAAPALPSPGALAFEAKVRTVMHAAAWDRLYLHGNGTGRPMGLLNSGHHHHQRNAWGWSVRPRNADDPPDLDPSELPDVTPLQRTFLAQLDQLLEEWASLEEDQKAEIVDQVLAIANDGTIADLDGLTIDTEATAALLAEAMATAADDGAAAMVEEAAEQGVTIEPATPDQSTIDDVAVVAAGLIGARLIGSAKSVAMRINSPGAEPATVAEGVEQALADLSIDTPRPQLSAALTGSQNDGRLATLRSAPSAALYASEVNDSNTCGPCREVDGKWLGNTEDLDQVTELYPGGAYGGFVDCEGRERCRGTITGVWRRGRR